MKKSFPRVSIIFSVLVVVLCTTACLKDDYTDFSKVAPTVQFLGTTHDAFGTVPAYSTVLDTMTFQVNITGPYAPSKPTTITFGTSVNAIVAYNSVSGHNTTLNQIPDSDFTFLSKTITVPAGQRIGTVTLLMKTANIVALDHKKLWALPLTITDASGIIIATNYQTILVNLVPNAYEGAYHAHGVRTNYASAGGAFVSTATWNYPMTRVTTLSPTTNSVHAGNSDGGFGHIDITTDPNDNSVTIVPDADIALNALVQSTAPASVYNPATKTFYLYYQYTNTTGTFRTLADTLTYVGP